MQRMVQRSLNEKPSHARFKSKMSILDGLRTCTKLKDLQKGKTIHEIAAERGDDSDIFVASTLINMYAKCGSMVEARRIFDGMKCHDVVSWNALLLGYVENGESELVFNLLPRMACEPDSLTFVAALKACRKLAASEEAKAVNGNLVKFETLKKGIAVHSRVPAHMAANNLYLGSSLVDMYARCGCIVKAFEVFENMRQRDTIAWNSIILGYAENGKGHVALKLFLQMDLEGFAPGPRAFVSVFKACGILGAVSLKTAVLLHAEAVVNEFVSDNFVANTLIDMYAKCGSISNSRTVFEGMERRDIVSWNALILGHADNGEQETALNLFSLMQSSESFSPDSLTYVAALKACTKLAVKEEGSQVDGKVLKVEALKKGLKVHAKATENNFSSHFFVAATLVDMYAKCGSMEKAQNAFDSMKRQNIVCWNALILGYADNWDGKMALELFWQMQAKGCTPDSWTFVAALKACGILATKEEATLVNGRMVRTDALELGRSVHTKATKSRCDANLFVANTLVDMYAKCGDIGKACEIFHKIKHPDVVSWNAVILAYADNGDGKMALELFSRMERRGYAPSSLTFVAALKACVALAIKQGGNVVKVEALNEGMVVHSKAAEKGFDSDVYVANSLVDMYAKCGSMEKSQEVFDRIKHHDVVCWNSLILGYMENCKAEKALEMFLQMRREGCPPEFLTFVAVLKAAGELGALDFGRDVLHIEICSRGLDSKLIVANSLMDFYGKCSCMVEAQKVFDGIAVKDSVSWSTLLAGYSRMGNIDKVFEVFDRMLEEKFTPESSTFLCVLTACSHAGLVERGKYYFEVMLSCIAPDIEHYNCMVDILGRANKLDECMKMINRMPLRPNKVTWMAVLSACSKWKNAELGKIAFESLIACGVTNSGPYVMMAGILGHKI